MGKPLLQIALDTLTIEEAVENVEKIKEYIDILEVGTILISSQGKKSIKTISEKYPNKIIVADGKIADAGTIFGKMFFDNGADFTTCICAAETATINSVQKLSQSYEKKKEVQIELTSHFTWEQVDEWRDIGIQQAVYHRSRDAQAAGVMWSKNDVQIIKKLISKGFKVTITGGIELKDLDFFKDLPIYIFIVGRSIRDAINPEKAARLFKEKISKNWG